MRVAILIALATMLAAAGQAVAQAPASLDIQAKKPLPRGKYAVDLTGDSELGRDIRRLVMEKLAARGHEVGFSGGHVMKLQISLTQNFATGLSPESVLAPPRGQVPPGGDRAEGRPPLPERSMRSLEGRPNVAPEILRITLTLQAAGSGEVIWVAYAACPFRGGRALAAGRSLVDAIFANPDRTRRGAPDCPP